MLPDSIKNFIAAFSALPSIGPRQATRLAFFVIRRGKSYILQLAQAIAALGGVKTCAQCFFPFEISSPASTRQTRQGETGHTDAPGTLCKICSDPKRRQDIIAIIEKEADLISMEKTKKFIGRYLILGELSKDGVMDSEQKLRLSYFKNSVKKQFGGAEEIILAFSPTIVGDLESSLLIQELKTIAKKITKLGRGLPTGGEIEFADEETLGGALENRR